MGYCLFICKRFWKPVFTIVVPIFFANIFLWKGQHIETPLYNRNVYKQPAAAFSVLVMASFWVSECLPLAITALCPVIFFPLFDIMSTEQACSYYLGNSIMLLLAGCMVAQAFEYSNFHARIALKVLLCVGAEIPRLLFGMIFTAMFLSMWMNNTSTTAMMVPIVHVIMNEFEKAYMNQAILAKKARVKKELREHLGSLQAETVLLELETQQQAEQQDPRSQTEEQLSPEETAAKTESRNIKIKFLLAIAWGSNIGGVGVSIGTAPNLIGIEALENFKLRLDSQGEDKLEVVNAKLCKETLEFGFLQWMKFCTVPMFVSTLATYIVLLVAITGVPKHCPSWLKCGDKKDVPHKRDVSKLVTSNITRAIKAKYGQLGPMSLHEYLVLTVFIIMAFLWITGSELWWKLFEYDLVSEVEHTFLHDFVPGLFLCIFLFFIPKERKYYRHILRGSLYEGMKDPLLKWEMVESELPWGPLIMIGGGGCLSAGIQQSGLGESVKVFLQTNHILNSLPDWGFLIIILMLTAVLTSIASNTAIIAILAPVLMEVATTKNVHPFYLVIVATVSCSFAFVLPISTPPNAIVYNKSDMKQAEMALPGILVTIVTNIILFGCVHLYADGQFDLIAYKTKQGKLGYCTHVSS